MIKIKPYFTKEYQTDEDLFASFNWVKRDAVIKNAKGDIIFEQKDVVAPDFWSDLAVSIVASKYFYGKLGTPERETQQRNLMEEMLRQVGAKIQPIDADIQETFQEWNRKRGLETLLRERGAGGVFEAFYEKEQDKEEE